MKKGIHPVCRKIIVQDINVKNEDQNLKEEDDGKKYFVIYSPVQTKSTILISENELPLLKIDTCLSHPFYNNKESAIPVAGRIDKFNKKYAKFLSKPSKSEESTPSKEGSSASK